MLVKKGRTVCRTGDFPFHNRTPQRFRNKAFVLHFRRPPSGERGRYISQPQPKRSKSGRHSPYEIVRIDGLPRHLAPLSPAINAGRTHPGSRRTSSCAPCLLLHVGPLGRPPHCRHHPDQIPRPARFSRWKSGVAIGGRRVSRFPRTDRLTNYTRVPAGKRGREGTRSARAPPFRPRRSIPDRAATGRSIGKSRFASGVLAGDAVRGLGAGSNREGRNGPEGPPWTG